VLAYEKGVGLQGYKPYDIINFESPRIKYEARKNGKQ
jgi:hypothetical protein